MNAGSEGFPESSKERRPVSLFRGEADLGAVRTDWDDWRLGRKSAHHRMGADRLGVEDSNLGLRIQSPLSYH